VNRQKVASIVSIAALLVIVLGSLLVVNWHAGDISQIGTEKVASALFDDYGIAFLVIGLVMFTAMLGGVFLAKEDEK
jgi:NADH:ubiquinone oxidoreductase subunit 6 (subunit J)